MPDDTWSSIVTYHDRASAEAIHGLLAAEKVPCYIASDEHVPGLGSNFAVRVPRYLSHRAQWILAQMRVSEEELTALALSAHEET